MGEYSAALRSSFTSMQSLLKVDMIKTTEYLTVWWDCGMISQKGQNL